MKKTDVDFTKHSNSALQSALRNINKEKFPENYEACLAEINQRKQLGTWEESINSSDTQEKSSNNQIIAGFWVRAFSDIIDSIILWIFAFILSLVLQNWFVAMGPNAIWIGLLISIAYFVPMQSHYGNGQSIGKSILGIQVLDLNGNNLSLLKSFFRYLIISYIAYSSIPMGIAARFFTPSILNILNPIFTLIWFVFFLGCYLMIPFHPLKRGLHDLIANSIVVYRGKFNAEEISKLDNPKKTKKVVIALGVVFGLLIISITTILLKFDYATLNENEKSIEKILESSGKFKSVNVIKYITNTNSGKFTSLFVVANVGGPLDQTAETLKPTYDLVFQTIRSQIKDPSQYSNYRVSLEFGYELGIRRHNTTIIEDENPNNPEQRKLISTKTRY